MQDLVEFGVHFWLVPKSGIKYGILEILEFCHLCAIMRGILYNQVFSILRKLFLLNWVWHVAYFCCPLLYLPWDWVELLELCSNLCGKMGELVANCEAVKVLVFSVPVLLAVIPLRPGCCNRGYQIFYRSLFDIRLFLSTFASSKTTISNIARPR